MKRLLYGFFALAVIVFCGGADAGCESQKAEPVVFSGEVVIHKDNGKVTQVEVRMPGNYGNGTHPFYLHNIEDIEALEDQLQSTLKDLQYAKEQMSPPVVEEVLR